MQNATSAVESDRCCCTLTQILDTVDLQASPTAGLVCRCTRWIILKSIVKTRLDHRHLKQLACLNWNTILHHVKDGDDDCFCTQVNCWRGAWQVSNHLESKFEAQEQSQYLAKESCVERHMWVASQILPYWWCLVSTIDSDWYYHHAWLPIVPHTNNQHIKPSEFAHHEYSITRYQSKGVGYQVSHHRSDINTPDSYARSYHFWRSNLPMQDVKCVKGNMSVIN